MKSKSPCQICRALGFGKARDIKDIIIRISMVLQNIKPKLLEGFCKCSKYRNLISYSFVSLPLLFIDPNRKLEC